MTDAELKGIRVCWENTEEIDWFEDGPGLLQDVLALLVEVDRLRAEIVYEQERNRVNVLCTATEVQDRVLQEREACAALANQAVPQPGHDNFYADAFYDAADQIEAAIRRRGEEQHVQPE